MFGTEPWDYGKIRAPLYIQWRRGFSRVPRFFRRFRLFRHVMRSRWLAVD